MLFSRAESHGDLCFGPCRYRHGLGGAGLMAGVERKAQSLTRGRGRSGSEKAVLTGVAAQIDGLL